MKQFVIRKLKLMRIWNTTYEQISFFFNLNFINKSNRHRESKKLEIRKTVVGTVYVIMGSIERRKSEIDVIIQ